MYKNNYYISKFLFLYQKRGEIMKKTTKITNVILGTLMVGFFALGFSSLSQNRDIEADAATVETKRVWLYPDFVTWWEDDLHTTHIYFWDDNAVNNGWPGYAMHNDGANSLLFYDVPLATVSVVFARVVNSTGDSDKQTVDITLESSVDSYKYDLWNDEIGGKLKGAFVAFTPDTTTIVADFAATIDTSGEACSFSAATAAVNAYNDLSTFEQNQFDVLDVGGGVTGLQRLNFLKDFYNIETSLNVSPFGFQDSSKYSWLVIGIGTLGVFALLSYFFVTKKKHYN